MERFFIDFGSGAVVGAPSFSLFVASDTLAVLSTPTLTPVGSAPGLYYFELDWSALEVAGVLFRANLGDVEKTGTLTNPSAPTAAPPVPTDAALYTGEVTLAQLRQRAKEAADMVDSDFVSDEEWNRSLNVAYGELYDLLATEFGDDYHEAPPLEFTADGATDRFTLPDGAGSDGIELPALLPASMGGPAGFYKLLALDWKTGGRWKPVRRFSRGERGRTAGTPRYRLSGRHLWIEPRPPKGTEFRVLYVPRRSYLEFDTDYVDGVSGWEELIVLEAALKALTKEESDTAAIERRIARLQARIREAAAERDAAEPARVVDVYASSLEGDDDEEP